MALGSLLLATTVLFVVATLGLIPTEGALGAGVRMAGGPAVTLLAYFGYRAISRMIDENESPLLGAGVQEPAPTPRYSVGAAVWVGLLGVGAAIAGSFVISLGLDAVGAPVEEQESIVELVDAFRAGNVLPFVLLAISATVLAPIAEESLFRGLVFQRIARRGDSMPEAFVLSAVAFATIHQNPAGFIIYVWLGLVFAECYRRTGRLWVAMLVHAGNNAFALGLLVLT